VIWLSCRQVWIDHDHADEAQGHGHEQQRLVADDVHLLDHLALGPAAAEHPAQGAQRHLQELAAGVEAVEGAAAEPLYAGARAHARR
jgi:hypothetical protein